MKTTIKTTALGLLCCTLLASCGSKDYKVTYSTEQVHKGDISTSITATGTIEPVTEVEVGTQVSGIIDKIYVDFNSEVKKGQLIAELDKTNLKSRLASANAQLTSAKNEMEYQRNNFNRMKELHDKQYISDDEFESARLSYDKARISYDSQKLSVQEAQTNLSYAYIYSPIDGVILSREVEEGQTVAASMTTPTLFTIAQDLTDMRVIADVDEADIGGVKAGQRVSFAVDAFPNDKFEGRVTQVRQQATTSSNVVTYQVVISAPNPDLKLMPGLTANVEIFTLELQDVLCVSAKALRYMPRETALMKGDVIEPPHSRTNLWYRDGTTLKAYPVQTGASNGVFTQILSGVSEGQEVINEAVINGGVTQMPQMPEQNNNPFMPGPPGRRNNNSSNSGSRR
ncbi:MAG: efflux RND transporter periplasmic adaptor subunit [Bacteroidales bacterium]|nr:efflux RND transporter periplasmic adaptor subunit [Bacteroidales bacterium]